MNINKNWSSCIHTRIIHVSINKESKHGIVLNANQHNFIENKSCEINLIPVSQEIISLIDKGNSDIT